MNNKLYKAIKITLGLFVFAVGIVMTINEIGRASCRERV